MIKPSLNEYKALRIDNGTIFSIVFILANMLEEIDLTNLITELNVLLEEFQDYINLNDIGFPVDWEEILRDVK